MKHEASSGPFVTTVDLKLADKMRSDLIQQGFELSVQQHTVFVAKKKGVSCSLYSSGKLVVQGKESSDFIEFYLEPEVLGTLGYKYADLEIDQTARIGIDESGKGDFFGPLCIAGVYAEGDDIPNLKKLGVRDSKKISDKSIGKISKLIVANYQHHVVKINPLKYNELYEKFGNLNHLLAWGHGTTIENLVLRTNCRNVLIDQFADESVVINALKRKQLIVELTQRHRGEEDLVVAAASILARQTFLEGLQKLSEEFGVDLPKGASEATIKAGRELVRRYGTEILKRTSKIHFKTLDVIMNRE